MPPSPHSSACVDIAMNYREFSPIFVIGRDETIRLEPYIERHRRATTLACVSDMTARQPIDNEHVCRNFASSAVFTALFIMDSSYRMTR